MELGTAEAAALRFHFFYAARAGFALRWPDRGRVVAGLWRTLVCSPRPRFPARPPHRPLLLYAYATPSNLGQMSPVAAELARRGWGFDAALGRGMRAPDHAAGPEGRCLTLRQVCGWVGLRDRLACWRQAGQAAPPLLAAYQRHFPELGTGLARWRPRLRAYLTEALLYRRAWERLLRAWQPSCVVSTSDFWPFEHTLFAEARRQQVPSLCIQHGVVGAFWWPSEAQRLLLWGSFFRDELLALGAPPERLKLCGMPASDRLFQKPRRPTPPAAPGERLRCVLLSNAHGAGVLPRAGERFAALLEELVVRFPSVAWRVKLHPIEDGTFYRRLSPAAYASLEILPKNIPLETAVSEADLVAVWFSGAAMEAMMMGRPLIVLAAGPEMAEVAWWPRLGGGMAIESVEQMEVYLRRFTTQPEYRLALLAAQDEFLARAFAHPGAAARAVVDEIGTVAGLPLDGQDRAGPAVGGRTGV